MAFQLILYAGAAYKNYHNMYDAQPGALGSAQVTPHWDNATNYDVSSIYEYEPMNLFPGWSLTNTRNNKHMLDPHMIFIDSNTRIISTDLHGVVRSGAKSDTGSMAMAHKLNTLDAEALDLRLEGSANFPNRSRRNSANSESLLSNEDPLKNRLTNIKKDISKNYRIEKVIRRLKVLESELLLTTTSGNNHYNELLFSLQKNVDTLESNYVELQTAKTNWNTNRTNMINYIKQCINDINKSGLERITLPRNKPH